MAHNILKFLSGISLLLLCFAFLSCSQFNYGDDEGRGRDRDGKDTFGKGDVLSDEKEGSKVKKNCGKYQDEINSHRFIPDEYNPLAQLENCLLKEMNRYLKPVCEEEKMLKKELRGNPDDETLEAIEERLDYLKRTKYEFAGSLYEIADGSDEIHEALQDEVDKKVTDIIPNVVISLFASREVGSIGDTIARKATSLCSSSLRRSDR